VTDIAQRDYHHLLGVHQRRGVYFSRGASPARTLALARPTKRVAQIGFQAGYAFARLLQRPAPLPASAVALLTSLGLPADEACVVLRAGDPSERSLIALGRDGEVEWFVKSEQGESPALHREAAMLTRLHGECPGLAPELAKAVSLDGRYAVIEHAVPRDGFRRCQPEELLEICVQLAGLDITHGDLAPWNLIRAPGRVVICDWESCTDGWVPMCDFAHFIVQSGSLLRHWSSRRAVDLLCGPDSPGSRFAARVGLGAQDQRTGVVDYLESSGQRLDQGSQPAAYRRAMLARIRAL
jgi:hypothetical protein